MSRNLVLLVLLAGCAEEGAVLPDDLEPTDTGALTDYDGPDLRVAGSPENVGGDHYRLEGTASGAGPLTVSLTSDVDGPLWSGAPERYGSFTWEGALSAGPHVLEVRVTDEGGASAGVLVTVVAEYVNRSPDCVIASPADGAVFASGEPIPFASDWADADADAVRLMWRSDAYGPIFMGTAWDVVLPPGVHNITLKGEDDHGGQCEDAIQLTVNGTSL